MSTNLSITSNNWLDHATKLLQAKNIKSARLDSLLLLEKVLCLPRIRLISDNGIVLSQSHITELNRLLNRRLKNEPIAYIIGFTEFYGRRFLVNLNVLIPRPESESLIELVKTLNLKRGRAADIGTGSGCLGVTLKLESPKLKVDLYDISLDALLVAEKNANTLSAKVSFSESNLLEKIEIKYNILMANLPYVPETMSVNQSLSFEPKLALFGGLDGMGVYRKFWNQVKSTKYKPTYILCESLENQHQIMTKLANKSGFNLKQISGLIQLFVTTSY